MVRMKGKTAEEWGRVFSIDCEMVDTLGGNEEVVKVSIVDSNLNTVFDRFIQPTRRIVNYRAHVTGFSASSFTRCSPPA